MKKRIKLCVIVLLLSMLVVNTLPALPAGAAGNVLSISVNSQDGSVSYSDIYDGPRIQKIRVLTDANFLEIYWDRYVDEDEAVDISNYVLKNGTTVIPLEAKNADHTNTLYFDKKNKEIAATEANSMARLDEDFHMSSICFNGIIDSSKGLTLEVAGDAIKDEDGKSAQNVTYTNIPYLSFYTQSVVSETGIVVKSDDSVAFSSLEKAAEQIDVMLGKTENGIAANMAKYHCSLAVYSPHQNVYLIPEHRYWFNKEMYDVEGYGGSLYNDCVSSIAERNILRTRNNTTDRYQNTMYRNENILIHEFGHCVKSVGMDLLEDTTLKNEFLAAYNHAKSNNLWPNTYCISNEDEFFATICTIWFNVMEEARDWQDGVRGPVNTREELRQYDPQTYAVFEKILPDDTLPSPWDTDVPDSYHDKDYDPNNKPEPEPEPEPADISALINAINRAETLEKEDYTEESWEEFEKAFEQAKEFLENILGTEDQDVVDVQTEVLVKAIENLEEKEEPLVLPFEDVSEDAWYYDAVCYNYSENLMKGLTDTSFGPDESLARAQFAVILHRMNGTPEVAYTEKFPDVSAGQWYTDAILWAAETKVVTGYSDTGKFGVADKINREQMAVMMYRYAGYMGYNTGNHVDFGKFKDAGSVNAFAREAMQWAVGNGIITGKDGGTIIDPQGNATRAECATIIQRFMENVAK